jgi:hypothetical protein
MRYFSDDGVGFLLAIAMVDQHLGASDQCGLSEKSAHDLASGIHSAIDGKIRAGDV